MECSLLPIHRPHAEETILFPDLFSSFLPEVEAVVVDPGRISLFSKKIEANSYPSPFFVLLQSDQGVQGDQPILPPSREIERKGSTSVLSAEPAQLRGCPPGD